MESTTELVTQSVANLAIEEPSAGATQKTFKQMTFHERLKFIKQMITVEPIIAAYVMAPILAQPALNVLEFEKACRANLRENDTICTTIVESSENIYPEQNQKIQLLISSIHSWQYPVQSIMPLILVLFLGSYSDRHQLRKPFLLVPLIGELFAVAGCILSVIFMKSWSLQLHGVLQTIVPSLFGGQTMIVMAVFAYIADVSTLEMRTLRIGVVQIVLNAAIPITMSFSALLFQQVGYIGSLLIAGVLYLFAIFYGIFWIQEPKRPITGTNKNLFADIFDTRHAIDTFKIVFKKQPGNDRVFIVLLIFGLFIYTVVSDGEGTVFFLYSKQFLQWDIVQFTSFSTANTVVHLIGTIFAVPLFTKLLKLNDITILFLTFLDKIITNLIFGVAKDTYVMYIGVAVSLIIGVTGISIRSLETKVVSEKDLGKAQSLFGIVEAIGPAVAAPVYNVGIYARTYLSFPSAYFYFGALIYAWYILAIIYMYIRHRKQSRPIINEINGSNGTMNGTNGKDIYNNDKSIRNNDESVIQITHM